MKSSNPYINRQNSVFITFISAYFTDISPLVQDSTLRCLRNYMLSMLGEQSIGKILADDIHILQEQHPDIFSSFREILNMNDTIKRSNAIIELCNQLNSLIFKKVDPDKIDCIGVLGESTCALSILEGNLKDINLSFQSEQAAR